MMSKQLAFYVDSQKCIGCFSCAMACKNMYHPEPGVKWRQVYPLSEDIYPHHERAFYSLACNHCEHPTCLECCPVGAYTKREDGIVVHDQDKCIGCGNCVRSCPYGAPQYNPKLKKAEKCSMCWERIDAKLEPACVQACPVKALRIIDLSEFNDAEALHYPPGFPRFESLNPSVRFKLPRHPHVVRRNG